MKKFLILVAGGKGSRMKTEIPKQFLIIAGRPVLMRTMDAFFAYDKSIQIILVLPEEQQARWKELCLVYDFEIPHSITTGGETRFHSVKNGLELITGDGLIAVHDGVRPFVSKETITCAFNLALEKGNAVPAIALTDSIRKIEDGKTKAEDRSLFRLIQTPQVFRSSLLKKAYKQPYSPLFTDDASVVEAAGKTIHLSEGNIENIKITNPLDLKIGELLSNEHN